MNLDKLLADLIAVEGGYVNDPTDRGGETNFGITVAVAHAFGYRGAMRDLPKSTAIAIYKRDYWTAPRFDRVAELSAPTAAELFDTGVNCGTGFAKPLLQRALNLLNNNGKDYPDLKVDGVYGPATLNALKSFLAKRGRAGELNLVKLLNCMQMARYVEICERNPKQEKFFYGWLANRVEL